MVRTLWENILHGRKSAASKSALRYIAPFTPDGCPLLGSDIVKDFYDQVMLLKEEVKQERKLKTGTHLAGRMGRGKAP